MATVNLEQLVKRYGSVDAVRAIDLDIAKGEFVALVGPSGCGKTSFLSCINRLTDYSACCAVSGRLMVGELDVLDHRVDLGVRTLGDLERKAQVLAHAHVRI